MHIEIEAKLKVDSLAKVARQLKKLGTEFLRDRLHTDTYFDDAKSSLRKSDSALRIRRQLIGRKEQVVITFKGPKLKGRFKQRQEIQFKVSDARLAEEFLAALSYKPALVFQKKRRVWLLGGCEVALDTLPLLGDFVEIEGPGEKKIAAVQKKLGLADLPHIPESYAVLMQKKLRKLGRTGKEVFF
ncbi:MAG: class IV adenylate cyclase [Planctomycetota bacterium]